MVAEKLDPTVGQLCFCHNFQTVRNLQKGTTGMSSEGPKMVEMSYGVAGNGQKIKKLQVTHDGRRHRFAGRSRRIWRRLAMKFHGRLQLDVPLPPVRRVYSDFGRNRLLWLKLERPANGSKWPNLMLTGLGSFYRVFGVQSECLGLGFPLARKAMYI